MAKFCNQCTFNNCGVAIGDFKSISTPSDDEKQLYPMVLCQDCGPCQVNHLGDCMGDCLKKEHGPFRVYNMHRDHPFNAVYIGRPSEWGNPFEVGRDGTREEVIKRYEELIIKQAERVREALKGKDLVCWCAPLPCHGDVLLRIANLT